MLTAQMAQADRQDDRGGDPQGRSRGTGLQHQGGPTSQPLLTSSSPSSTLPALVTMSTTVTGEQSTVDPADASWTPIIDFIDDQHESYMRQEQQPHRKEKQDLRIHACLYFIRPSGAGYVPVTRYASVLTSQTQAARRGDHEAARDPRQPHPRGGQGGHDDPGGLAEVQGGGELPWRRTSLRTGPRGHRRPGHQGVRASHRYRGRGRGRAREANPGLHAVFDHREHGRRDDGRRTLRQGTAVPVGRSRG